MQRLCQVLAVALALVVSRVVHKLTCLDYCMQNLHWHTAHGACMTKPSHISLASCKVAQLQHTYVPKGQKSVVHAKNLKMVRKHRAQLQLQNVVNYSSDQFHAIKDLCWILITRKNSVQNLDFSCLLYLV